MAVGQLAHAVTDTLLSGASPLPHVDCVVPAGRAFANWPQTSAKSWAPDNDSLMYIKNVGGGLLPMAVGQLAHSVTDTLLSGASPFPHLDGVVPGGRACANWPQTSAKSWAPDNDSLMYIKKCGRGLAPDGGGSACTCSGWHSAIGSKPPPTFGLCCACLSNQNSIRTSPFGTLQHDRM